MSEANKPSMGSGDYIEGFGYVAPRSDGVLLPVVDNLIARSTPRGKDWLQHGWRVALCLSEKIAHLPFLGPSNLRRDSADIDPARLDSN